MTITTTPATTAMTMAIVLPESSVSESSAEKQTRALSLKANCAVNRNIFFSTLACLFDFTVFSVTSWRGVRPKSCVLHQALLSCFLVPLHWTSDLLSAWITTSSHPLGY